MSDQPLVGVLAIQGGFEAHVRVSESLNARTREVRTAAELEGLGALVIPGGESTAMSLGIERGGLAEPLRKLVRAGTPTLGTCAGLIVLDSDHLGLLDVSCRRNAFGRQVRSFEADLDLGELGEMHAVFIRAPWVEDAGPGVEVLAALDGHPVAVSRDHLLAVAFHPELSGEDRLHRWLVERSYAAPTPERFVGR